MDLRTGLSTTRLRSGTRALRARLVSDLTGLSPSTAFLLRGAGSPRVAVATGRLAHIEPLAGHTGRGVHHIAGAGLDVEGATIAVLAETVERYAQYAVSVKRICKNALRPNCWKSSRSSLSVSPGAAVESSACAAIPKFTVSALRTSSGRVRSTLSAMS